jgi:hypothetical protein
MSSKPMRKPMPCALCRQGHSSRCWPPCTTSRQPRARPCQ